MGPKPGGVRVVRISLQARNGPFKDNLLASPALVTLNGLQRLEWRNAMGPPGAEWTVPVAVGKLKLLTDLIVTDGAFQGEVPAEALQTLVRLQVRVGRQVHGLASRRG